MTFKNTVTFAARGSALSFTLAFCGFPLQLFGSGKLAQALWWIASWAAGGFAVMLLGCALGVMGRALWKNSSMDACLYPWLMLLVAFVIWWALFGYLSKMP